MLTNGENLNETSLFTGFEVLIQNIGKSNKFNYIIIQIFLGNSILHNPQL